MRKVACSSAGNLHSIGTDPPFPRASLSEAEIKRVDLKLEIAPLPEMP